MSPLEDVCQGCGRIVQWFTAKTRISTVLEILFSLSKALFANLKAKSSRHEFGHALKQLLRNKSEIFVSLYCEIPTNDEPLDTFRLVVLG